MEGMVKELNMKVQPQRFEDCFPGGTIHDLCETRYEGCKV